MPTCMRSACFFTHEHGHVAVSDACRQLNERLAPVRAQMSNPSFTEVVNAAHLQRLDLSAHGFYITPGVTGVCLCGMQSSLPMCRSGFAVQALPWHSSPPKPPPDNGS